MSFSPAARAQMLDSLDETPAAPAAGAAFGSLHTAYSSTGANEAAGGSPAYARKALTWAVAVVGPPTTKALSAGVTFDVAAGTYGWLGLWTLVTGGTFLGMLPLGAAARRQFNVSDAADVTANIIDSPAHGLAAGNGIVFWAASGAALPTGLTEGTVYYVIATGLTTDAFSVSTTVGGSAVDITANGDGEWQNIVPETYAAQGQMNVTAATMSVAS